MLRDRTSLQIAQMTPTGTLDMVYTMYIDIMSDKYELYFTVKADDKNLQS